MYRQLLAPDAGLVSGDELEPVRDLRELETLPEVSDAAVWQRVAIIKLNGGLGTSMGLSGPKSLIEVKPGCTFLDVIARQVLALRRRHSARLPLVLMNSFSTQDATLARARALRRAARRRAARLPPEPGAEAARR